MKNKLNLLLIPVLLIIPNVVNASNFCPHTNHERIVTNPNGIDINCSTYSGNEDCCKRYEGDECVEYKNIVGHIKQNETFIVHGEYTGNEEHILISYNNEYYELSNFNGTKVAREIIIPEENMEDDEIYKATENNEALIYADNGADIRKGPAKAYDIIGHIEKGTKLKYTYYYHNACKEYIYIEHNGIKGWVETTGSQVLLEEPHSFIVEKDTDIGCTTIPANTTINTKYANNTVNEDHQVLIEYNNCQNLFQYSYYGTLSENITELDENGEKTTANNTADTKQNDIQQPVVKEPNYITLYIIACSIIIIATITIVVLVNKKKTQKEDQ